MRIAKILACIYLAVLIYITLFSHERSEGIFINRDNINLDLFAEKIETLKKLDTFYPNQQVFVIGEMVGNALLFFPFPFALFGLVNKRVRSYKVAFIMLGCTLLIETLQLLFKIGMFDVDDIFLNFLGGIIGLGVFNITYRKLKKK